MNRFHGMVEIFKGLHLSLLDECVAAEVPHVR